MQRYGAYKDSGVEWIGEIPAGWEVLRLKNLLVTSMQYGATEAGCDFSSSLPRYIRITDIDEMGRLKNNDRKSLASELAAPFLLEDCDLLFARSGATVGKSFLYRSEYGEAAFAGYLIRARPDQKKMIPRLLELWTQSGCYESWKNAIFNQATIQNIGADKYSVMPLPVPPLPEQQAIADYLDAKTAEIDSIVSQTERSIELLREYRKSVISEAVTKGLDPNAPMRDSGVEWIGEIPEGWILQGFTRSIEAIIDYRGRTPEKVDSGVFLITARNIKEGKIDYDSSKEYVREEEFESIMARGKLTIGDVLFTMEAPLGQAAVIDNASCAAAQRIVKFCCNREEVLGRYLVYWIMSSGFQQNLQTFSTGSTASGIKASKLSQLIFVKPPLPEQQAIADYLDAKTAEIDSLIADKQRQVELLREYRKSLISEAVTGKFKVPGLE